MARETTLDKLVEKLPPDERKAWDAFHADTNVGALRDAPKAASGRRGRPHLKALRAVLGPTSESDMPTKGNAMTFDKVKEVAAELGKQAGLGRDTGGKFYYSVTEAAFNGAIDLTADKHGKNQDDAAILSEAYYKAQSGNVIYDAKAGNQRKLTSCVRTCIKLGGKSSLGRGEPMNTVDDFVSLRRKLRTNPANAKKLDDFPNSYLRMARAQIKSDTPLTADVLTQLCYKKERDEKTVADAWAGIRKAAQGLLKGKGGISDDDPRVKTIIDTCTERLKDLVAPPEEAVTAPVTGNDVDPEISAEAMSKAFAQMEAEDEANADVKEATA